MSFDILFVPSYVLITRYFVYFSPSYFSSFGVSSVGMPNPWPSPQGSHLQILSPTAAEPLKCFMGELNPLGRMDLISCS